jgi:hypothetical protein
MTWQKYGFLILTYLGGILSLRQVYFFFISIKILDFFYTLYDLFPEKKISLLERAIFQIFWHKNRKRKKLNRNKIKKNSFSKIILEIFCRSKTTWSIVNLKNHWTLLPSMGKQYGNYVDRWPLNVNRCPLTAESWPMNVDRWPLTVDRWPLTIDRWHLTFEHWKFNFNFDLWPWSFFST